MPFDPERPMVMSRFAWLRRDRRSLIAETSRGPGAVRLEDPRAAAVLTALATPATLDAALAAEIGLPLAEARELAERLADAEIVLDAEQAGEEDEPPLAVWEFHDLLFHARSRAGRHGNPAGGTYRFAGRFPIAPALPPPRDAETIALPRPDWERLEREDPPLAAVQSERRSTRRWAAEPITVEQLAELLFRVGRVDDVWQMPGPGHGETFVAKPYPSGGSLYELELYVAAQACAGLEPGLYHYAADRHALEAVASFEPEVRSLVADAAGGMGVAPESLQTVVVIAARMGRIAWKYQSLAYSLVLKHVGVVLQTVYLSATAMGIGACAVGSGDSDRFARAAGLDLYAETAVGEIVLGSLPV